MGIVINFGKAKIKSDLEKEIIEMCELMILYHREDKVDTFEYGLLLSKLFALGLSEEEIFEMMLYSEFNK